MSIFKYHRLSFLSFFLLLIIVVRVPIYSYIPGKWSPLSAYILKTHSVRPTEIVIKKSGKVVARAKLYYRNGRLYKELYKNRAGKTTGSTVYEYKKRRLWKEKLLNKNGKILELKTFRYNDKKGSVEIEIKNLTNKQITYYQGLYVKKKLISGELKFRGGTEKYRFYYDSGRLRYHTVLTEKGRELARIDYFYSKKGIPVRRIKKQGDDIFRCDYVYKNKRIVGYKYYRLYNNKWVKDKSILLIYD